MKDSPKIMMRATFSACLHEEMRKNKRIYVVVNDLGYKMWDDIRKDFPERFVNVGAAEQTLIGVGVGLALENKIPIVYSITSFLLYRPFETIRNYIDHEKMSVKLIGSGRDKDYLHDGISHWSEEDKDVMKIFKNIKSYWPKSERSIPRLVQRMIRTQKPFYINLKR